MNILRRFKKLVSSKKSEIGTIISINSNNYVVRTSTGVVLANKLESVKSLSINDTVRLQNDIIVNRSRTRSIPVYYV